MVKRRAQPGTLRVRRPLDDAGLRGLESGAPADERQRVECVLCRKVGPAKFLVEGDDVRVRCLGCGGEWALSAPAPGPAGAAGPLPSRPPLAEPARVDHAPVVRFRKSSARGSSPPLGTDAGQPAPERVDAPPPAPRSTSACPKCTAELAPRLTACPSCGLARARFARFDASRARRSSPELASQWEAVRAAWDDPAAHRAFLEHTAELGEFAAAAARYRSILAARPDDAVAAAQIERLAKMVAVLMLVERKPEIAEAPEPFRRTAALLLVLVLALGALGGIFLFKRRGGPAPGEVEPAAAPAPADDAGAAIPGDDFARRKARARQLAPTPPPADPDVTPGE